MNTAIIIPAYNVSSQISTLLVNLLEYKQHVIFIDDGSTDDTFKKISHMDFFVLRNTENCGIANATFKGLRYVESAGYSRVVLMDADGQHSPKYINEFINYLNDYDFVFGNRFHKNTFAPSVKWNSNIFGAALVNDLFNTKFTDIACGYKAFKITNEVIKVVGKSNGYELVFDLLLFALTQNSNIKFVDIEAMYSFDEFLATRPTEMLALIDVLSRYFPDNGEISEKLSSIRDSIYNCNDFVCASGGIHFYAYFIRERNLYIVQADPKSIQSYIA